MPELDPRRTRLTELRERLAELGRRSKAMPLGSADHDALAEQYGALLGMVLGLAEELEAN